MFNKKLKIVSIFVVLLIFLLMFVACKGNTGPKQIIMDGVHDVCTFTTFNKETGKTIDRTAMTTIVCFASKQPIEDTDKVEVVSTDYEAEHKISSVEVYVNIFDKYRGYYPYYLGLRFIVKSDLTIGDERMSITGITLKINDEEVKFNINCLLDVYYIAENTALSNVEQSFIGFSSLESSMEHNYYFVSFNEKVMLKSFDFSGGVIYSTEDKQGVYEYDWKNINAIVPADEYFSVRIPWDMRSEFKMGKADYFIVEYSLIGSDEIIRLPCGFVEYKRSIIYYEVAIDEVLDQK